MSWAKTLRGWALGDDGGIGTPDAVAAPLAQLVADLRWRAGEIERHSEQAPNEASDVELKLIAAETSGTADRLAAKLGFEAVAPVGGIEAAATPPGDSHWARLVQDLEDLRTLRGRLLRLSAVANDADDELAAVIEGASRTVESELLRLRGLIARADPQALN